jgi:hypothetical protein
LLALGDDTGSPIDDGAENIEGKDFDGSGDWIGHFVPFRVQAHRRTNLIS